MQALTIGVVGAGVMLGFIDSTTETERVVLFLLPLAIILPLWTTFFDKARTISRIVGFMRVQEALCSNNSGSKIMGWETALKQYWSLKETVWDNVDGRDELIKHLDESNYTHANDEAGGGKGRHLRSRSKLYSYFFWATSYSVFAIIGLSSLALSLRNMPIDLRNALIPLFIWSIISLFLLYILIRNWTPILCELHEFILKALVFSVLISFVFFGIQMFYGGLHFFTGSSGFLNIFSVRILGYNAALATFILVASVNFWIFQNLVRGRYSAAAFEKRWSMITDHLDTEIAEENLGASTT